MLDDAALLLEEIPFEDKNHNEAWRERVIIAKRLRQTRFHANFGRIFERPKFRPASTPNPIQ
jgi:hypothetical protein